MYKAVLHLSDLVYEMFNNYLHLVVIFIYLFHSSCVWFLSCQYEKKECSLQVLKHLYFVKFYNFSKVNIIPSHLKVKKKWDLTLAKVELYILHVQTGS